MYDDWLWPILASLGAGLLTFFLCLLYYYLNDRK